MSLNIEAGTQIRSLDLTFGKEVGVLKSLSSDSGLKTLCKLLKGQKLGFSIHVRGWVILLYVE